MNKFSKIISTGLTAIMLLSSMCVGITATENCVGSGGAGNSENADLSYAEIRETYEIARKLPRRDRDAVSLMRANTTVTVNAVCDQDWLDVMSEDGLGGLDDAEFIIDEISEKTEEWVGVRLYGYAVRATNLTQTGTNGQAYVDEAWSKYGKGSRDLMMAFYGITPSQSGFGGWAYFGLPKCALFLQTYNDTWKVGRHETGHMYNVKVDGNIDSDCYNECVMNDDMYVNSRYDKICSYCLNLWNTNKNRY